MFDGREHVRFATLPGMWERTLTVGSAGSTSPPPHRSRRPLSDAASPPPSLPYPSRPPLHLPVPRVGHVQRDAQQGGPRLTARTCLSNLMLLFFRTGLDPSVMHEIEVSSDAGADASSLLVLSAMNITHRAAQVRAICFLVPFLGQRRADFLISPLLHPAVPPDWFPRVFPPMSDSCVRP